MLCDRKQKRGKDKGKDHPVTCLHKHRWMAELQLHNILQTLALERHGWLASCPGQCTTGKDPVLTVQQAGWALGPVWMGIENCDRTGIQSPNDLAHS